MMLTAAGCRNRRERLWQRLEQPCDWILISDPQHLAYFANYCPSPFVFRTVNSGAVLILGRDGSSALVADNMVHGYTETAHVDEVVAPVWYRGQESAPQRETMLVESTLKWLDSCAGGRFGVELGKTPVGVVEGLRGRRGNVQLASVDSVIHQMKRSKDADEMELIRASMQAGVAAHRAALRDVRAGMTELDVFLLVEQAANRAAGEQAWVYGDFVSGPRCEKKGGPPTDRVIEAGDLVLLDFSVVLCHYRGDFANTFVCDGAPSNEQVRLYQACLDALAAGESMIRAGQSCRELDRAVRNSFAGKRLAETFTSHSGHGLGLGHPDPPYLVPESSDTLVAGDIIAIEPGQYVPGVGGMRYERNYLVTADGFETLSDHPLAINARS